MHWKINIAISLIILSGCAQQETNESVEFVSSEKTLQTDYLIEIDAFMAKVNNPSIKLVDFRKKENYDQEHIEGALHIWRNDIEDASFPYEGMMAGKTQIENLFSNLGINNIDTLVVYDDNGLCDATRLWWMLQNYDFTNIKLLHGGIEEWKKKGGLVSSAIPVTTKASFKLNDSTSMKYYISKESIIKKVIDNVTILDTRSTDEFSGKRQKKGAAKAGRIPNSINLDWAQAIDYNGNKKFKPFEELTAIYNGIAKNKEEPIVVFDQHIPLLC
mgnify:CR=1 FL=1|jgi:thiosulfate/3-mercaptopyruvate sulfurtransferase|tara:strand:+ start:6587 stop:7405 length:819 start_codon:yes stop_codon:yes gene_type:complete